MSVKTGTIRQLANDQAAFDIRKRSPEQIAQLLTCWKGQRRHLQLIEGRRVPPPTPDSIRKSNKPHVMPAVVREQYGADRGTAKHANPGTVRCSKLFLTLLERDAVSLNRKGIPESGGF